MWRPGERAHTRVRESESHKKTIAIMMYSKLAPVMWTVHNYRLGTIFLALALSRRSYDFNRFVLDDSYAVFAVRFFITCLLSNNCISFSVFAPFFSAADARFVSETRTFKFKLFLCVVCAFFPLLLFELFLCIVRGRAFVRWLHCVYVQRFFDFDTQMCTSKWMF